MKENLAATSAAQRQPEASMAKRTPPKSDQQPDLFSASFTDLPIRDERDIMEWTDPRRLDGNG